MSDLIERQAAKEAYCKKFCHPGVLCPDSGFCREVDEAFDPVPSAQPEIVRCKDCIKREICRTSTTWAVAPKDDWYCADAERRTDEGD